MASQYYLDVTDDELEWGGFDSFDDDMEAAFLDDDIMSYENDDSQNEDWAGY